MHQDIKEIYIEYCYTHGVKEHLHSGCRVYYRGPDEDMCNSVGHILSYSILGEGLDVLFFYDQENLQHLLPEGPYGILQGVLPSHLLLLPKKQPKIFQ